MKNELVISSNGLQGNTDNKTQTQIKKKCFYIRKNIIQVVIW